MAKRHKSALETWMRYTASIPYAVARYRELYPFATDQSVDRYEAGMWRYARILERAASPCTKIKRQR